jgi:alkylation response protein AidB-like acyl-CoA dehydrogenase
MYLGMPGEGPAVAEMFERFFESESTSERVRHAEPCGFDHALWKQLVGLGVPVMRTAERSGGGGMSLLDACLMMEQAGRRLASAPLAEVICAARLLGEIYDDAARAWLGRVASGEAIVTISVQQGADGQIVAGGQVADAVVTYDGADLALVLPGAREPFADLGGHALARVDVAQGERVILASGANAVPLWQAAMEEWKLLTAAALLGLSREALTKAAEYAGERSAFGALIGTYQAVSHPLANDVIDVDGGALFLRRTLQALAAGESAAGAMVAQVYWWSANVATRSVAHALHTFGGYGLTNEYDMQLYHRRAKAWALVAGDPKRELLAAGRRQFAGETVALPDPGEVDEVEAEPAHIRAIVEETRRFFDRTLTPELRAKAHFSFDGHDWGVHRALASERLLYPEWPEEWGGRNADGASVRACLAVWEECNWTTMPRGVTSMIGKMVMMFGNDALKAAVLPRMASGEITASLGYTEPSGGSDVFAARTRAERDGDDWVINGQKMFTSGSEHASYVFLLARTDKDAPKHKGLTMFLVPLDHPGVEIQPVHTFMDERTNATFYSDVRISDDFRVGDVNGGTKVMAAALTLEQGGSSYFRNQRRMIEGVVDWARGKRRDGRPLLDDPDVLMRLARTSAHANIGECLSARVHRLFGSGLPDLAWGPANKVFVTETFITDSADLLDLAAPDSLARGPKGLGFVEEGYRHSTATSVYAGTSEVLRSMVAERRLALPRSRG